MATDSYAKMLKFLLTLVRRRYRGYVFFISQSLRMCAGFTRMNLSSGRYPLISNGLLCTGSTLCDVHLRALEEKFRLILKLNTSLELYRRPFYIVFFVCLCYFLTT